RASSCSRDGRTQRIHSFADQPRHERLNMGHLGRELGPGTLKGPFVLPQPKKAGVVDLVALPTIAVDSRAAVAVLDEVTPCPAPGQLPRIPELARLVACNDRASLGSSGLTRP